MEAPASVSFAWEREAMDYGLGTIIDRARGAQKVWSTTPLQGRLRILRDFRHALAESARDIAATVPGEVPGSLHRTLADTLVAEVLPLAEACRFLEQNSASILAPRRPSNRTRPFWLRGVMTEIHREPFGVILIIGPGNYPLFLPGVQALQALAAGNAVLWKPAPGASAVAKVCRLLLIAAGLDEGLLQILDEAPAAATAAIRAGVDKVFLTGSESTGRAVLHELAETLTPSVMELSGCDAVFILDGADLDRAVAALAFGLRLNGSATCMSPRRIFVTTSLTDLLTRKLIVALAAIDAVAVPHSTEEKLLDLLADAEAKGARFALNGLSAASAELGGEARVRPTIITHATAEMRITQTDIFAPVLSIMEVANEDEAVAANTLCPYALTASIFGPEAQARRLAARISAGSVLINDIIVSTADPRAPFGGQRRSGFGTTRGREGLLEMTMVKTIQTQSARDLRAYAPPTEHHVGFFDGYLQAVHGGKWRNRWGGVRQFLSAMMKLK